MPYKRVLLSAFACDPHFGSDEEVGWQWAKELSTRGYDVTVLTRRSHQLANDQHVRETGECAHVRFEYLDVHWVHSILHHFNRRNHIYYYLWQWLAYRRARTLHHASAFDLIHHVTWVSFRQPSFMGLVGAPFYFGPVAGGDKIPRGYTLEFGLRQRLIEWGRGVLNSLVRFDPLMYLTYATASKVFFTSTGHLLLVPRVARHKAAVELAIGCQPTASNGQPQHRSNGAGFRLLFVGRCIGWKGMDFGLRAFQRVKMVRPEVTLTIVGDGADRERWMAKAVDVGINHGIEWLGWMPKTQVQALYPDFDLMFYPSLRDSGGFVVLEALQNGIPVVCFKLGGPGVIVDDSCGAAIEPRRNVEETVAIYADAVVRVLQRTQDDNLLAESCRKRASMFTWDALVSRIYAE